MKIPNLHGRLRKLETLSARTGEQTGHRADLTLLSLDDLTRLAEIGERLNSCGDTGQLLEEEKVELAEIGERYA